MEFNYLYFMNGCLISRFFLSILFICSVSPSFGQDKDIMSEVVVYSSNGNIRTYFTVNPDSLARKIVSLSLRLPDSVVTFNSGVRNGPALFFYDDSSKNETIYLRNQVIAERLTDAKDEVLYMYPLDTSSLDKSVIVLSNGRDFVRRNSFDTISIVNKTIPVNNRMVYVREGEILSLSKKMRSCPTEVWDC